MTSTRLFDAIIAGPVIGISDIYKAMHQNNITVSLDGHGADEYAFGYNYYSLQGFYDCIKTGDAKRASEYAEILGGISPIYHPKEMMNQFHLANSTKAKVKRLLKNILKPETATIAPEKDPIWDQLLPAGTSQETIGNVVKQYIQNPFKGISHTLYEDFHFSSLPINLRDFDRAAMQHSIEIRMPFMDYRLVSFMFSLPEESKLGHGFTKRIIRDAMQGIVPESIRTRKLKIGIASPLKDWMSGPLKELVMDTLASSKAKTNSVFLHGETKSFVENTYKNNNWNSNNSAKIWSLLNAVLIDE